MCMGWTYQPYMVYIDLKIKIFTLLYLHENMLSVFWNRGSLNQRVNLCCVPLIPDGGAKRHKVYTGSGNRGPTSSPRDRSCIPCTGVLVVGGYKLGERGN